MPGPRDQDSLSFSRRIRYFLSFFYDDNLISTSVSSNSRRNRISSAVLILLIIVRRLGRLIMIVTNSVRHAMILLSRNRNLTRLLY